DELSRLSTAGLLALPPLGSANAIKRTGHKRSYALAIAEGAIEPLPGHRVQTVTVNGTSPGPVLHMVEGDDIEVSVVNRLKRATALHWHGIPAPFAMDSAPVPA